MRWSTLQIITESKAFWSLNGLFFLVPFLAKLGTFVGWDLVNWQLFCLYLAAWILLATACIFAASKPDILAYKEFSTYRDSGKRAEHLTQTFKGLGGIVENVTDVHIRNKLENVHDAAPDPKVFWYVYDFANHSKKAFRLLITGLLLATASLLFSVNAARFVLVTFEFVCPQKESSTWPQHDSLSRLACTCLQAGR